MKAYEEDLGHIHSVIVHPNRASTLPSKRLIYIPGMSGTADQSVELLEGLDGVESFAMSLRGRGKSKAPDSNFTFDAHVADVRMFLRRIGTPGYFLHSYSVSTAFVLGALASGDCPKPAGLIVGDYPARYSKLSAGWAAWFSTLTAGGRPTLESITLQDMEAIERDSEDKDLSSVLKGFDFPVLIMKANGAAPAPSPITAADLDVYRRELKNCRVVEFESDHFFRDREREKYVQTLLDFMR
ncbi:MAG: hypothetical protein RL189_1829 [Pseudomonadota bacterium]